jgi:anthranilate/para-aminobenzoate synthase component I
VLSELVVDLPAEPFSLARRLSARDSVSLFWGRAGRAAFLCCDPVEQSSALDPEPGLTASPRTATHAVPRWVGLLPYECRRDLERGGHGAARAEPHVVEPKWLRYAAVAVIDASGVRVVGDDASRVRELASLLQKPAAAGQIEFSARGALEPAALHEARIARALEHIRAGDLYQVNLARRFEFNVRGAPWDLLAQLGERALPPFAAAFSWADLDLVSLSPELFLKLDTSGTAFTSPIKGTRPRGVSPERDAQLTLELDRDPKERAELTMVLDVERNDLARVSMPGSIELAEPPHVETHGTVHHRVATLCSRLKPEVTRREVLSWMLPSGSVTGAPKVRAMDLIAELEAERRGLYTGALGYIAHDGSLELSMAIRALTVKNATGYYFAGGGIVADSDPAREVEETLWKTEALLALLR